MELPTYLYTEEHDVLTDALCNESPMAMDALNTDEVSQNMILLRDAFEDAPTWEVEGFHDVTEMAHTAYHPSGADVSPAELDVVGVRPLFASEIFTGQHPSGNIPVEVAEWLVEADVTTVMEPSDDPLRAVEQAGFRHLWEVAVGEEGPTIADEPQLMVDIAAVHQNVGTPLPWYQEEPSV